MVGCQIASPAHNAASPTDDSGAHQPDQRHAGGGQGSLVGSLVGGRVQDLLAVGLTSACAPTTTVGTVSLPPASERTRAAASGSR